MLTFSSNINTFSDILTFSVTSPRSWYLCFDWKLLDSFTGLFCKYSVFPWHINSSKPHLNRSQKCLLLSWRHWILISYSTWRESPPYGSKWPESTSPASSHLNVYRVAILSRWGQASLSFHGVRNSCQDWMALTHSLPLLQSGGTPETRSMPP